VHRAVTTNVGFVTKPVNCQTSRRVVNGLRTNDAGRTDISEATFRQKKDHLRFDVNGIVLSNGTIAHIIERSNPKRLLF